jgi:hypothetical protein
VQPADAPLQSTPVAVLHGTPLQQSLAELQDCP